MTEQKRVALITGGIGGIGTAICQRLTQDGYQVVANCHPSETEAATAWRAARAAEGLEIETIAADVASFEDSARMVNEIKAKFGPVSVLVNCAGITRDKTFRKMEPAQWEAVINVNLNSVFNVTRAVWEGMLEQGWAASSTSPRSTVSAASSARPTTPPPRPVCTASPWPWPRRVRPRV